MPALGIPATGLLLAAFLPVVVAEQVLTTKAHEPAALQRWEPGGLCPAGYYRSEKSRKCEECEEGVDYTSYPNNLPSCFRCRMCREEEKEKSPCSKTRNTVCHCKDGTFREDGSPEFCRKCRTSCPDGKVMVSSCTSWSDLKCVDKESGTKASEEAPAPGKPVTSSPGTPTSPCPFIDWPLGIGICVGVLVLIVAAALFVRKMGWWTLPLGQRNILSRCPCTQVLVQRLKSGELLREPPTASLRTPSSLSGCEQHPEHGSGVLTNPSRPRGGSEAEDNDRNEVLSSKASHSSLVLEHETDRQGATGVTEQSTVEKECLLGPAEAEMSPVRRKLLVPVSGVDPSEALRMLFSYCTEVVPFKSWDQLMEEMGLTPNEIHLAKTYTTNDPLYEMLQKWLNKKGRNASINTLLGALHKLKEIFAREKIEEYAVNSGNFVYEEDKAHC